MSAVKNISFDSAIDTIIEDIIKEDLLNIEKAEGIMSLFQKPLKKKQRDTIYLEFKEHILYNRVEQSSFSERILIRWGKVIDQLEILIEFSMYSIFHSREFVNEKNIKNYVLIRLHAKMILISKEILLLIRNGYGEGANARWRSLYETVVIATFLSTQNSNVSSRYLLHRDILNFKEANGYKQSYKKLKHKGYGFLNLNELKKQRKKLLEDFGETYKQEYGWIPDEISTNKNFREIEKLVDMGHFNPYYKFSSRGVHASVKSFDNLGTGDESIVMVGPSNIGLVDPIQNTAIFLMKGTVNILTTFANGVRKLDNKVVMLYFSKIFIELEKGVSEESIKIEKKLYEEEYHE